MARADGWTLGFGPAYPMPLVLRFLLATPPPLPQDAPYMLEAVAEEFKTQTSYVQLTLLTASMKLFFQRPPQCQRLIGTVLKAGTSAEVEQVSGAVRDARGSCESSFKLVGRASLRLSPHSP